MEALLRMRMNADAEGAGLAALSKWLLQMETWRYAPHAVPTQLGTLQREFRRLPWPTAFRTSSP
jgi:hypothetical protein